MTDERRVCDVCANPGASPVEREELREGAARWIRFLCAKCLRGLRVNELRLAR